MRTTPTTSMCAISCSHALIIASIHCYRYHRAPTAGNPLHRCPRTAWWSVNTTCALCMRETHSCRSSPTNSPINWPYQADVNPPWWQSPTSTVVEATPIQSSAALKGLIPYQGRSHSSWRKSKNGKSETLKTTIMTDLEKTKKEFDLPAQKMMLRATCTWLHVGAVARGWRSAMT